MKVVREMRRVAQMEIFRFGVRGPLLIVAACLYLMIPAQAHADTYVVQPGDTLTAIAARTHVSASVIARDNRLLNRNLVQIGRRLYIRTGYSRAGRSSFTYLVKPGDTLSGLSARFGVSIPTIRQLNPRLGKYPLYGTYLRLCSQCSAARTSTAVYGSYSSPATSVYVVQPGDTLSGIAARFGTTVHAMAARNSLLNTNTILYGTRLIIPTVSTGWTYDPWEAKSLIVTFANYYGLDPTLPLAVAWQESGYNQTVVSRTGAIGVMQVEPYTGTTIEHLWGQKINLYDMTTNIHAGVYWLARLLNYYSGNERLAIAAYYEGTRNIARFGFYQDTVQYVADVLALQTRL